MAWSGEEWPERPAARQAAYYFPTGVRPPSGCGIKGYSDEEFRRRLLINFVLEVLREGSKRRKLEVTLVDIAGACAGVAVELIERSAALRVLTLRPRQYDACCAHCIRKYGVAPMVGENPDVMASSSFIVARRMGSCRPFCLRRIG